MVAESRGRLFIIDNADDLGMLHEMHAMPPGHARGHVLVTTRANLSSSADSLLEKLMPLGQLVFSKNFGSTFS